MKAAPFVRAYVCVGGGGGNSAGRECARIDLRHDRKSGSWQSGLQMLGECSLSFCSRLRTTLTTDVQVFKHDLPLVCVRQLSSMEHYAAVNAVFASQFPCNPPVRACVAVPLSAGVHVALAALVHRPSPGMPLTKVVCLGWSACSYATNYPGDMMSPLVFAGTADQPEMPRFMHVQTVSHWAPANIGPYSQAVQVMCSCVWVCYCG